MSDLPTIHSFSYIQIIVNYHGKRYISNNDHGATSSEITAVLLHSTPSRAVEYDKDGGICR